jgi:hypothetical protein
MNNILYQKPLRAFDAKKDIDSAPFVYATQENNYYHVWTMDDNEGTKNHGFYYTKEQAIDAAAEIAKGNYGNT